MFPPKGPVQVHLIYCVLNIGIDKEIIIIGYLKYAPGNLLRTRKQEKILPQFHILASSKRNSLKDLLECSTLDK